MTETRICSTPAEATRGGARAGREERIRRRWRRRGGAHAAAAATARLAPAAAARTEDGPPSLVRRLVRVENVHAWRVQDGNAHDAIGVDCAQHSTRREGHGRWALGRGRRSGRGRRGARRARLAATVGGRRAAASRGSRVFVTLTVRVPHRRREAHDRRAIRKVVGELELRLEKAALTAARRRRGARRGGEARPRGRRRRARRLRLATHSAVPGGPTSKISQMKRLSSLGPTEMPSGGLLVISARARGRAGAAVGGARTRQRATPRGGARARARRGSSADQRTHELPPNQLGAKRRRRGRARARARARHLPRPERGLAAGERRARRALVSGAAHARRRQETDSQGEGRCLINASWV
jgi:hypothetical protein